MNMIPTDMQFIKDTFRQYYENMADTMPVPDNIQSREFGYQLFDAGWTRHISVENDSELRRFLTPQTLPISSYYCSVSYYDEPSSTPMDTKKRNGADLIFDIDAKDLNMDCRGDHAVHVCGKCDVVSDVSSICCGTRNKAVSLPCNKCIGTAKEHADRLTAILLDKFGVDPTTIKIYFSGHEGYHIHVTDPVFHLIESYGRSHLVKYLMNNDIKIDAGVTTDLSRIFRMPGTLNSKSGMSKTDCIDPFHDAVVLNDQMIGVKANCPIPFTLKKEKFGPYATEQTDIPAYTAVYLILKGLAHIAK